MKLYHYTKIENLESIIGDGGLRMSMVESFNDPYDCILFEDVKDKEKVHKLLDNYFVFAVLSDFAISDYGYSKIKDRILISAIRKEINIAKKVLSKNPVYYEMPLLNKAKDTLMNSGPIVREFYKKYKKEWDANLEKSLNDIRKQTVVTSFSKRNDSMLMWSHYANSHRGVCLEYEVQEDNFLKEVNYSKDMVGIKIYNLTSIQLAKDYLNRNGILKEVNYRFDDDIYKPFFIKALDWEYEDEVRYVFYTKDLDSSNRIILKDDKYLLKLGKPKAIYIGSKANMNDTKKINDLANTNNINVFYTKLNKTFFKIDV
ncbi:MAG: DUF2971 domain-containing protein [Bacilli bacterium]|nr:DUF2971 domain-containing protein [Bacilli bacterium]